jgi:hypothetical protein
MATQYMEDVSEPQAEYLDRNLSSRFPQPDGSVEKKAEEAEPTWFANVQKTIAEKDETIAAQKDEIVDLKIKIVTATIELETFYSADAEYRESHERDAKENAVLLKKLKGEKWAYDQGRVVGLKLPTITNAKLDGAREHLEKTQKTLFETEKTLEKALEMVAQSEREQQMREALLDDLRVFSPIHAGKEFWMVLKHYVEVGGRAANSGGSRGSHRTPSHPIP